MSSPTSSALGTPSRQRVALPITLAPRALLASSNDSCSSDDDAPKSPSRRGEEEKMPLPRSAPENLLLAPDLDGVEGLLDAQSTSSIPSDASDDGDGASAYERVKRSLMGSDQNQDQDDDGDDELPIAPRRKRAPKVATSSPSGSLAEHSAVSPRSSPAPSSRASPKPAEDSDSDSDSDSLPEDLLKSTRFLALLEKRRKQREAKEAVERQKEQQRRDRMKALEGVEDQFVEDGDEDDTHNDRQMASQPTRRKASKKALEEMHKESQRLARNMQLEHEARTRKKITKQSLFDKFNFKAAASTEEPAPPAPSPKLPNRSEPSSIVPSGPEAVTTGPALESTRNDAIQQSREDSEDLPDALDLLNSVPSPQKRSVSPEAEEAPRPKIDKGKGRAVSSPPPQSKVDNRKGKATEPPPPPPKAKKPLPNVRVLLPIRPVVDDSDSDLEIVDPRKQAQDEAKRLLREKQELIASMRRPRPIPKPAAGSPNAKTKLTPKQMQLQLLHKGRLQAIREREERIQELTAKGVIVQTAEERERELQEVEDLLEKARREALEIKRREKKEERLAKGEKISDRESDDGDSEWMEEDDEEGVVSLDESELAYSEDEEGEEEEGEGEGEARENKLVDGEAEESGSDREGSVEMEDAAPMDPVSPAFSLSSVLRERNSISPTPRLSDMPPAFISDEDSADDDGGFAPFKRKLPRKKQRVTDEDDEDGNAASTGAAVRPTTPEGPKIPDIFMNAGRAPAMGMTQLFAATLGGGSARFGSLGADTDKRVDAMRKLPDEILPNSQAPPNSAEADVVPNTQVDSRPSLDCSQSQADRCQDSLPVLTLDYSQSQVMDSQPTQLFPDPTQDMGFEVKSSPAPPRFEASPEPPEGSVPTQVLDEHLGYKRPPRGRLVRRAAADFSDEERGSDGDDDDMDGMQEDAFAVLKKAARMPKAPAKKPFDKTKSGAKAMVDERAVESEDEFGGIGGGGGSEGDADDDDDDDAMSDEEMKDLLDDGEQEVDKNALAAFYAQREKLQDEKEVNRLFRSIQNGMLRKRGAGFDLDDDSDDEHMAQERRRRAKRRQMAQIRKALLQDEALGKIAEDPKKAAFFRSLADNASDDDGDFLDKTEEDLFAHLRDESQSQVPIPDGEIAASPGSGSADGPPPPLPQQVQAGAAGSDPRRPVRKTKPSLNIRETLSILGVQEDSLVDLSESGSEDDSQRQRRRRITTAAVIDRTISRTSSSISLSTKLAFQAASTTTADDGPAPAGFRVPSLLRRATSSSISTASQNSTTTPSATTAGSGAVATAAATTERSLGDSQGLKMGGTKSSSINFRARAKAVPGGVAKAQSRKLKEREKEVRNRAREGGGVLGNLGRDGFS